MSDLSWDTLEAESRDRRGSLCKFGLYLATLDDQGYVAIEKAFANPDVKNTPLHKALAARGYEGSAEVLRRHRSGECCCSRVAN